MVVLRPHQTVRCKTIDDVELEAWLFPSLDTFAPIIIMTHGLNCVKEMSLTPTCLFFQSTGYNVLLYDPRGIGASGGYPRNQINPYQNAEDILDVVTFAQSLPNVDPNRIFLWGMSLGGTTSGVAASLDRRISGLIMVAPIFKFVRADKRAKAFQHLIRDRQSQLRGNPPYEVPPFNSKGENLIGYAGSGGEGGREAYELMRAGVERGHPSFRDRITLQSWTKLAYFRPREIMEEHLEHVPTMFVVPELDSVSLPDDQREVYLKLRTRKRLYEAKGMGHMSILSAEGSQKVHELMVEFFDELKREDAID